MNVKALIQRVPVDPHIVTLTEVSRSCAGVPAGGFDNFESWQKWTEGVSQKMRSENFTEYFKKVEKLIPYKGVISKTALRGMMLDFYYLKVFDIESQYKKYRFDLFSVGFISNKKTTLLNLSQGKGLKDGVYIHIPSNIDPSELKDYVAQNKEVVSSVQSFFNKRKGYDSPDLKYLESLERDQIIAAMYEYTLSDLEEISKIPRRKGISREDYIAKILVEYLGFKPTSGDAVLKAKKRWQGKQKKLWGTTNK